MRRFCKISILGSGAFGTAMAHAASFNPHNKILMYARDENVARHINEKKRNPKFLSEYELNGNISVTTNFQEAIEGSEFILSCLPTQVTLGVLKQYKDVLNLDTPFISCSKGMIVETEQFISEAVKDLFKDKGKSLEYGVLSGPSFAKEIIENMPTLVVVASENQKCAELVQHQLSHGSFRVYTNNDVIGSEVAGALKNVLAIGAGIIEGSGFGINTTTGFIVRGTLEIQRFAQIYGAKRETFFGLAGVGDLMLTCFGSLSRNRTCGFRIGKGEKLQDIINSSKGVVEGIPTIQVVTKYAKEHNIFMPITFAINDYIFGHINLQQALKRLMFTPLSSEFPE